MSMNIQSEYEEDVSFYDNSYTQSKNIKPINLNKPCRQYLKKKFKKYRLRKNGLEDPEVLDVSALFDKSFTLKEPGQFDCMLEEPQEPRSFFMKMLKSKSITNSKVKKNKSKVETNAFQLLMDSRNKSIGSNSPGKEKKDDDDQDEFKEFHKKKSKRKLALEKMAEAKGSLKRIELEKLQENVIKQKLNERKKKLKKMLTIKNIPESSKPDHEQEKVLQSKNIEDNFCDNTGKSNTINIIKKIKETDPVKEKPKIRILKEDEEFLSKLSPSIRKKENMLSYFQKIEKNTSSADEPEIVLNNNLTNDDCQIIKVKLKCNKNRKKKISLNKAKNKDAVNSNTNSDENNIKDPEEDTRKDETNIKKNNSGVRKRKRNTDCESIDLVSPNSRPKRISKKPIKYVEDYDSGSSSDEPILNLKKEKSLNQELSDKRHNNKNKKNYDNKKVSAKKNEELKSSKLAPIFAPKPMIDNVTLEARQKFLSSGMPEKLLKIKIKHDHSTSVQDYFFSVGHVQQRIEIESKVNNQINYFDLLNDVSDNSKICNMWFPDNLIIFKINEQKKVSSNIKCCSESLNYIKQSYPNFPVYRTYRFLKSKKIGDNVPFNDKDLEISKEKIDSDLYENEEDKNRTNWTDRYRATSTQQIIGNFDGMKELRKWLVTWTESMSCKNSQNSKSSDESDCFISDDDSTDANAISNNVLVISGPPGTGKTSCVYAVAEELSIKVIEVNASSKRTGKILLQDLHEATQSHKVNRVKSNSQNSQTLNNIQKTKKGKNKIKSTKKPDSGESLDVDSKSTAMSLILIDDADVVFEQDDGFASAITQLISSSKRPMVLVTSSLSNSLVQKYVNCCNVIKLNRLLPKMLGTWLDILCLADTGMCWPGVGTAIVNFFAGDIRKSINYMEFYALSELQLKKSTPSAQDSEESDYQIQNDDNSSTSWAGKDNHDDGHFDTTYPPSDFFCTKSELNMVSLWWNLPKLLNAEKQITFKTQEKPITANNLKQISSLYDSLSVIDCLNTSVRHDENVLLPNPWYCTESDSVVDRTSNDMFNSRLDLCEEISNYLAQYVKNSCSQSTEQTLFCPKLTIQKEREKIISKHNVLADSTIPNSVLDRRSVTLDYWSACRTICRIEKEKSSCKRNNRFHHYLKNSKISSQVETFSKLCTCLNIDTVSE